MSLLDLIGLNRIFKNGVPVNPTRKILNFIGATVEDDPANDRTNITVGAGGGGGGVDLTPEAVLAVLEGQEIKALANPTAPQSAATRSYVDGRDALKANTTTTITAGAGLTGGGTLAGPDVPLAVGAADGSIVVSADAIAVGVITDAQHGTRGAGTTGAPAHTLATTTAPGLMAAADKVLLAGKADVAYVDTLVQGLDPKGSVDAVATVSLTLSGLQTVDGVALTAGMRCLATAQSFAPANGLYVVGTGAWTRAPNADTSADVTTGLYVWTSNGANKGGWFLTTPDPITLDNTALTFERYEFGLGGGTPQPVAASSSAGNGSTASPWNHVHAHGAQPLGDGTGHALATVSVAGFMSAADKSKMDGLVGGSGALVAASQPDADVTSTAGNTGTATTAARSDHTHGHGNLVGGTLHAVATGAAAGFMAAADKTKLDGLTSGAALVTASQPSAGGVTSTTGNTGAATTAARSDHSHGHGDQLGGTLHAVASSSTPGFLSAADKGRLDALYAQPAAYQVTRAANMDGWPAPLLEGAYRPFWDVADGRVNSVYASLDPAIFAGSGADNWHVELAGQTPDDATAITSIGLRLKAGNKGAPNPLVSVTLPTWELATYDADGVRAVAVTTQSDNSPTPAAYALPHSIAWSGNVPLKNDRRYVVEIEPDKDTVNHTYYGGASLLSLSLGFECRTIATAERDILAIPDLFSWVRADSYVTAGGKITALIDRVQSGHTFAQASGAQQALNPVVDSALNNQLVIPLAGTSWYDSTLPASAWKFAHDASGFEFYTVYKATSISDQFPWSTRAGMASTEVGNLLWVSNTVRYSLVNGSVSVIDTGHQGVISAGAATYVGASYSSADSPTFRHWLKSAALTVNTNTGAPSAANPQATMRLFSTTPTAQLPLACPWAETLFFKRALTAAERTRVRSYIQTRYGIAP